MKTWPDDNAPATFDDICDPLIAAYRQLLRRRPIVWDGLPLGRAEAATCPQPDVALAPEQLAFASEDQDRRPIDVLLAIAVQLGIEQGRRLATAEDGARIQIALLRVMGQTLLDEWCSAELRSGLPGGVGDMHAEYIAQEYERRKKEWM